MAGTLLGTYLTGRSRSYGMTGTWGGEAFAIQKSVIDGLSTGFLASVSQVGLWEIDLNVLVVGPTGVGAYGGAGPATLVAQWDSAWQPFITGPPSAGVDFSPPYPTLYGGKTPFNFQYSGKGTWGLSISQVVEVVQIYLDTDRSDASGFPTYGGPNQPDQPFNYQRVFFEVVPPGAVLTLTASYDGGPGASVTLIGTANQYILVGYPLSVDTLCVCQLTQLNEHSCAGSCYVTPDGSNLFWGIPFTQSYSFPPAGAASTGGFVGGVNLTQTFNSPTIGVPSCWCIGQAQYMVQTPFSVIGTIQTPTGLYPDTLSIAVDGGAVGPVSCFNGTFVAPGNQYAGNAVFQAFYVSSTVANSPPFAFSQSNGFGPVDCYIPRSELIRLKEDPTNWRILQRSWRWPALAINQQSTQAPDPVPSTTNWSGSNVTLSNVGSTLQAVVGATGTGSISRSFPNASSGFLGAGFIGYRYLRLYLQAADSMGNPLDAEPFAVTIAAVGPAGADGRMNVTKTWAGKTSVANLATDIDLCIPDVADGTDATDARYPLTTPSPRAIIDGPFWGVSNVQSLQISNLPANTTWILSEVQLARQSYTRVTMLPGFNYWVSSHDSDAGEIPDQYGISFTGETDGRQSLEGRHADRSSDGMGGWLYNPFSVAGLVALIGGDESGGQYQGWQVSTPSNPPGSHCGDPIPPLSCFTQNSVVEAICLAGGGLLYVPAAAAFNWQRTVEQEINPGGATILAQYLCDSTVLYPGCGDIDRYQNAANVGKYGVQTILAAGKINLRGNSWGILARDPGDSGQYPATLTDTTLMPSVASGTGTCDIAQGLYQTANPGARGLDDTTTQTNYNGTTETVSRKFKFGGRRYRACLRASGKPYRVIEADSLRSYLHVSLNNQINTFNLADLSPAFSGQVVSAADYFTCIRIDERRGTLVAGAVKAGMSSNTWSLWYSTDCGLTLTETWSMVATGLQVVCMSLLGLFAAVYADASHNLWIEYSQDGGQTWNTAAEVTAMGSQLSGQIESLAFDPRRSALLMSIGNVAGTTAEIYGSTDAGLTWGLVLS